jgi:hypothetical protein
MTMRDDNIINTLMMADHPKVVGSYLVALVGVEQRMDEQVADIHIQAGATHKSRED